VLDAHQTTTSNEINLPQICNALTRQFIHCTYGREMRGEFETKKKTFHVSGKISGNSKGLQSAEIKTTLPIFISTEFR
jgi:hypothetical protein